MVARFWASGGGRWVGFHDRRIGLRVAGNFRIVSDMNDRGLKEVFLNARFEAEEPEGGWPDEFGVLTACNPDGVTISVEENAKLTHRLELALLNDGKRFFPVTGYDPGSDHKEAGFGIVCGKDELLALGRAWDQLAVFWVKAGKVWLLPCVPTVEGGYLRPLREMLESTLCYYCGARTRAGICKLEYTWGGFLFAGISRLTLFFRSAGQKRVPVMGPDDGVDALFCDACGTLVLQGERALKRVCGKCGGSVVPGEISCGTCHEPYVKRPTIPSWIK